MKPDTDLQKLVMQELASDPHVDESAIGVSVRHGVVTLDGIVRSAAEKENAEAAAYRVPNVHDVANEIELRVGWSNPTDPEIAEAVRDALASSPLVRHEQIQTTVSGNGRVTLHGTVATPGEREAAEAIVRVLRGVELVTNSLVVATAVQSWAAGINESR